MDEQQEPWSQWLRAEDFVLLHELYEQLNDCDADGYTLSKHEMKRLAELGVVQSHGFGRYSITSFGIYVIRAAFLQEPRLPLETAADFNARKASEGRDE